MKKFLLDPFDEAEKQTSEIGQWVVATVEPQMAWPAKKQTIHYRNKDFILFPKEKDQSAGVALRADLYKLDRDGAIMEIAQFCSALSWRERAGLEILHWGGGNLPRVIGILDGRYVVDFLNSEDLPEPAEDPEKASLAFYREGVSLKNPFYSFLSLFKAVSVLFPAGKDRQDWMSEAVDQLDDHRATKRKAELEAKGINVSEYIWEEGRNAIAHAERKPYVNPDEYEHHFRLKDDIPLIKNLAELAVESKAGLKRSHTIWKEHAYELAGFRAFSLKTC